jgi:cytochrome d ubiquinol oxidase subunit I
VSALSIARRRHLDAARASLKLALPTALAALALVAWSGHASMRGVMQQQPMKFAAMEAHWERGDGPAALTLFALPDSASGQNRSELQLPYLMSWLATHSNQSPAGLREGVAAAEQRIAAALRTPGAAEGAGWRQLHAATAQRTPGWNRMAPAEQLHATALAARPDVPTLFFSFRLMIGSGVALAVLLVLALRWRAADAARGDRRAATLLCIALPLPWIATLAGWTVAEVGRQPWVVYEEMTTLAAVRLPPRGPVVEELAIFVAAYTLLGSLFAEITRRLVLAGPEGAWLPARWRMRIRTWRCGSPGDESLAPASRFA